MARLKKCKRCLIKLESKPNFDRYPGTKRAKDTCKDCLNAIKLKDQFWGLVNKSNYRKVGCWKWKGKRNKNGYGLFYHRKGRSAHRFSFLLHNYHPSDKLVIHSCDNPCCVRPDHLRTGTHLENMIDAVVKQRYLPDDVNESTLAAMREIVSTLKEEGEEEAIRTHEVSALFVKRCLLFFTYGKTREQLIEEFNVRVKDAWDFVKDLDVSPGAYRPEPFVGSYTREYIIRTFEITKDDLKILVSRKMRDADKFFYWMKPAKRKRTSWAQLEINVQIMIDRLVERGTGRRDDENVGIDV